MPAGTDRACPLVAAPLNAAWNTAVSSAPCPAAPKLLKATMEFELTVNFGDRSDCATAELARSRLSDKDKVVSRNWEQEVLR